MLDNWNRKKELTRREKQVLFLLAHGEINAGIALMLGISEATVQHHIDSCKYKLQAQTRAHAIWLALQDGVFEDLSK